MSRIHWCSLLLLFTLCNSQDPTIKLIEPLDSATYVVNKAEDVTSTATTFEVVSLSTSQLISPQLCIQLKSYPANEELVPLTCFEAAEGASTKTFNGLPVGTFFLTLSLHGTNLVGTHSVTSSFHVKSIEQLLPHIELRYQDEAGGREMTVPASASSETALTNAEVKYSLGDSLLKMEGFEVCVTLTEKDTDVVVLQLACVPTTQRLLTFQALNVGSYSLSMVIAKGADHHKNEERTLFPKSEMSMLIHVKPITDSSMMPLIAIGDKSEERGIRSSDDKADFTVHYSIRGEPSAVSQVQVCAQVDLIHARHHHRRENSLSAMADHTKELGQHTEHIAGTSMDFTTVMTLSCIAPGDSSFTLNGIGEGKYDVKLLLRLTKAPHTIFETTETHINLDSRVTSEFVPSYNWQSLHAWHTIPPGIQARLPLSSEGRKEAKIPEPWQLQLLMPSPCKYFLRMNVDRYTTVSQIIEAAAKQCKMDPSSFILTADDMALDVNDNVEVTNFFNAKHGLQISKIHNEE